MFEGIGGGKGLLSKFGGHPMAAGLSLPEANVEQFRLGLNRRAALTEGRFCSEDLDRCPYAYELCDGRTGFGNWNR